MLLAAGLFLALSLVIGGVILVPVLGRGEEIVSSTPFAAPPAGDPSALPQGEEPSVEAVPSPTPSAAPPPLPSGPWIAVAALEPEADPAMGAMIRAWLDEALPAAALPEIPVVYTLTSQVEGSQPTIDRDAPGSLMLITWRQVDAGLLQIGIEMPDRLPQMAQIGMPLHPWEADAPEGGALYTTPDQLDLSLTLALALLEAAAGAYEQAALRLESIQGAALDLPAEMAQANQAAYHFAAGLVAAGRGDGLHALRAYSDALRLNESLSAAVVNRANLYLMLGDPGTALAAYNLALSLDGTSPYLLHNRALAQLAVGDPQAALADAGEVVLLTSGSAWALNLRGLILYTLGEYDHAHRDFTAALELAPDALPPLFNDARTLAGVGDYQQALASYDRLLEMTPDDATLYLYQAEIYQQMGDLQKAVQMLGRAIRLDEAYLEAYLRRGVLLVTLGQYDEALADAEAALTLDPTAGRAYHIMGDALLADERWIEARDAYTGAIENGDAAPQTYAGRGWANHRLRFLDGAIRDYQQALTFGYDDPLLLYRLGFALFDAGRFEDALNLFYAAINQGLDTAETNAALALALDATVRRSEAERAYRRALEMDSRYGNTEYLAGQPLWTQLAVARAVTILRRLEAAP
ncbi:MAG: hypothetical protein Kow00124_03900 [Anaerolineae bacterium]